MLDLLPKNLLKVLSDSELIINYFNRSDSSNYKLEIHDYMYKNDPNYNRMNYDEKENFIKKASPSNAPAFYSPCTNHIFIFESASKESILHEIGHFLDNILPKENNYQDRADIIEEHYKDEDYISSIMYISNNDEFLRIYNKYHAAFLGRSWIDKFFKKKGIDDEYYFNKHKEFFAESFAQYLTNGEKFKEQFKEASEYIEKFIKNYDSLRNNKMQNLINEMEINPLLFKRYI